MKSSDRRAFVVDARLLARLDGASWSGSPQPSPRQMEILGHLAESRSHRAIAEMLGIRQSTVDRHIANLYIKMGVSSRIEAIEKARRLGWLDLE